MAAPNLIYPAQGATSLRPHAPISICGTAVTYDANGNTRLRPGPSLWLGAFAAQIMPPA
jgi:hypothetical protein